MSVVKQRIIKKYLNRRLYDTELSSYITQDHIKQYVSKGIAFRVISAKTGEDTTRTVLMHIILDEEIMGVPLFTEEALRSIILFSGSGMRGSMSSFLEQMLPAMHRSLQPESGMMPEATQTSERFHEHVAALQGMMLGNSFQEYMNRSLEMIGNANRTIAKNTAKMMKIPPSFGPDGDDDKPNSG